MPVVLHGARAVAALKFETDPEAIRPDEVLHGARAVAALKLQWAPKSAVCKRSSPRRSRRGRIEVMTCPEDIQNAIIVLHVARAVAALKPIGRGRGNHRLYAHVLHGARAVAA